MSGASAPPFPRTESPSKAENGRLKVTQHPPFNGSARRFNKHDAPQSNGPEYHVAYRDIMQPERRATKGWTSMDDTVKGRRGTGAGKVFSSMAPSSLPPAPGSQLQPIYTSYPNETRLQELLDLQRRRLGQGPGPGQYEMAGWQPSKTCFRRQALPQLDGPFLPPADTYVESTRVREMGARMRNQGDSGIAPGDYESHASKDVVMKTAPAPKIGTGMREGRNSNIKSLSVSRSIQHGIDWHVPVVVQVKQEDGAAAGGQGSHTSPRQARSAPAATSEEMDASFGDANDGGFHHEVAGPSLPPPVGGKAPPPPAAVARSIRRPVAGAPGDWDWQQLGHNYRNNWTTLHGGAYSQGDRSTARRDTKLPDAVDYMGHHTESIDPRSLPPEALGEIFPIPEEGSEGIFDDITGRNHYAAAGLSRGSDGRTDGMGMGSPSTASMTPQPGSLQSPLLPSGMGRALQPGLQMAGVGPSDGTYIAPAGLLSVAEVERREAALQAALMAQQAAARRAAWNAKAGLVL